VQDERVKNASPRLQLGLALAGVAAVTAFALPQVATAGALEIVDRGVIQSITADSIALRALDGSTVQIPLGPSTTFRLNGAPATVAEIKPGHVASVFHEPSGTARLVRAFGTSKLRTDAGTITAVERPNIRIRTAAGETLTIRIGLRTRLRFASGRIAKPGALKVGREVRVTYVPGKVAELVIVFSRP
jgi:hypothetical protein